MPADERPIENGCPGRLRSLRAHFQLFVAIFDNKTMQRLSKRKYMRRKSVGSIHYSYAHKSARDTRSRYTAKAWTQ